MLGNNWGPEFFKNIKDDKIRSPLQQIAEETLEDLLYFENILRSFGCKVIRPIINKNDRIENYIDSSGKIKGGVPRNALQPRDFQIVAGNKLYSTFTDNPDIVNGLLNYGEVLPFWNNKDLFFPYMPEDSYNNLAGTDWPSYEYFLEHRRDPDKFLDFVYQEMLDHSRFNHLPTSANSFFIGQDLYLDYKCDLPVTILNNIFTNSRLNVLDAGHTHHDGCFHPIKPGAILSIADFQNYTKTFPEWEVFYVENENFSKLKNFSELKKHNNGSWWSPESYENLEFSKFVNSWLSEWTGYIEESFFDVNVLVLDEYHVCVNNLENKELLKFLKKHKMEPVHVPWRHRYFWDGGLHCITLDLYREGIQKNYFPNRMQSLSFGKELING